MAQGTLLAAQTISATGSSYAVPVDGLTELLVAIEVSSVSSFSTIFAIDTLLIDGTWDQIAVTSAVVANGITNINLGGGSGVDFGNTVRVRWTVSTGTAVVTVTFEGK
jgi:hypothetical protein